MLKTRAGLDRAATATPPAFAPCSAAACRRIANRRLRDIADARIQIEEALNDPTVGRRGCRHRLEQSHERLLWMAACSSA